jgi:hypothetical protein
LAFPYYKYLPLISFKCGNMVLVSHYITEPLGFPITGIRSWFYSPEFAVVHMPKAAMHKYDFSAGWKNQIRFPWQIAAMQAVAIT